ncbi:exopolyphosphatase/guanosine-5'-triphosphate,3'-diphosphate pyrophosphatase [Kineosphaera limosa]|uniref:Putative phosphatase n=1 Tax=Kineosphaera limosa NBRC 100340 TaxID=1184609 RepID=K6VCX9_9MICO|nr:exopolyphosphatase [Kineosphaera limosa]NYE02218.1 exopolyphosphatase/guanosine-5'-triphosphate,3'-diphosphate pyrophosphatase [Kineosphaera limosa]GAB94073.1 putative phosphatase [Kineosphaera limosa NBRC 100340]
MRVAAVDCGTNSIRLLVADVPAADAAATADPAPLAEVVRRMEIVRLGQGIDATGAITPEAMERTLARSREYAHQCAELEVDRVRFVATSASRDARNADEFVAGVRAAFASWDIAPEVITGAEEALLSFTGSTGELAGAAGVPGPYLVVDLGGGSTEFVRGDLRGGQADVGAAISTNIGCVRFHERFAFADPPTREQIERATTAADVVITQAQQAVGFTGINALVGLAGTVTTIAAHALRLPTYDRDVIHGSRLPVESILEACDDIVRATVAQRSSLGFMHPGRADVIGAGALIWGRIVARVADESGITEVVTSEHDILDGIALSLSRA